MKKELNKKGIFLSIAVIALVFIAGILSFNSTALSCSYCGGYTDSLGNIIRTSINNSLSNSIRNTNTNNNNSSANAYATGGNSSSQSDNNSINYINIGSSYTSTRSNNHVASHNDDLDVECRVSDTTIEEGDRVTFTADVSGGDSPYDYDWSGGTEGEDDNDDQISVRYDDAGRYYVRVTVEDDDGNTASDSCPTVRVEEDDNNDDLEVICRVSDTTIEEGDRVTFTADVDGGDSPYDYEWDGDTEGEDENDDQIRVRYDDDGRYEVEVTVRDDDGNRASDDCPVVRVSRDNNDNNNVNIITTTTGGTPNGQLASLSSVYLSQVPYTGPEEIMKGIGFVAGILMFSALIAYLLFGNRKKTAVSKKVSDFKESNRKALKI